MSPAYRSFTSSDPDYYSYFWQKNSFFGLVSLPSASLGQSLVADINRSLKRHHKIAEILTTISQNPSYQSPDISLVLGSISRRQIHLGAYNSGTCFLSRQSTLSRLLSLSQTSSTTFISGPLHPGDRFFLLNHHSFQSSIVNHLQLLFNYDPPHFEQTINSSPQSAALVIDASFSSSSRPILRLPSRRKLNLVFSVLILLGLITTITFAYFRNRQNRIISQYQQLKSDYQSKIDQAEAIRSLDLDNAQELARQAQKVYQQLALLQPKQTELANFQQQLDSLLAQTGDSQNFRPDFFYDTSLIHDQPQYRHLFLAFPKLYLFDSSASRLDALDLTAKSISSLSDKISLDNPLGFLVSQNKSYFYNSSQLFRLDSSVLSPLVEFPSPAASLQIWNDNFYLLSASSSAVWKFSPATEKITDQHLWLKSDQTLPSSISSFAADTKLWFLSENGSLTPYLQGAKDKYSQAIISATEAKNLRLGPKNQRLVFFDSQNFVYVFSYDGQSLAKYNLSDQNIIDLVFDDSSSTIFLLLSDQKIYKISPP